MNKIKAAPRRQPGTRQDESAIHHKRLIASIVPHPHLAADYAVLAVLLHRPDLAAPYVTRLHAGDWETDLHRVVARIALSQIRTLGRVDRCQLVDVLLDADTIRPESFALELATLARVADLIHGDGIVADAVAVLAGQRRGGRHDRLHTD